MQYAFLIYGDETAPFSPEQEQQMWEAHGAYNQMLIDHGVIRGGAPLHPSSTSTLVRRPAGEGDERLVTDGPFTETKEQLGGFYLVECADLDKALEYARQLPLGPGSAVEVRPVVPMPGADGPAA
ncbi:MAG: YciI family protein [Actinomycetota bacterium]|nr:YciI family protein [Actinomycetota bacterium]